MLAARGAHSSSGISPADLTSDRRWTRVAIAACLAVVVISRLGFLSSPFQNDAGIYVYMGKTLADGGRLYHDFYETKFPTVALLTAPLYAVFGATWAYYVVLQLALAIAAAFVMARSARRNISPEAYLPTLLGSLVLVNCSRVVLTGFQLETLQAVFAMAAAAAVLGALRRDRPSLSLLAGLAAGAAAMTKPTGLAVSGAAAAAILWQAIVSRRFTARAAALHLAALCGGALLPLIAAAVWIWFTPLRDDMPELFHQIKLYGDGTPWRAVFSIRTAVFMLLPISPMVIRWTLVRWRAWRSERNDDDAVETTAFTVAGGAILVFAIVWLIAEAGGVVAQKRCYSYHFLVLAAPAALLFGLMPLRARLIPLLIALAPVALISLAYSLPMYAHLRDGRMSAVSEYIVAHTTPEDAVWSDPSPRLLLETHRPAGARLPHAFFFVNYDQAPPDYLRVLLDDLEQRRPKYVVFQTDHAEKIHRQIDDTPGLKFVPQRLRNFESAWRALRGYVASHYVREAMLEGRIIYRRHDQALAAAPSATE